jgi:uncharacterized protein
MSAAQSSNHMEVSVLIARPEADVRLAGTLTLPRDGAPRCGMLLVPGSGPQDRDQTLFGRRPFAVLAEALTDAGVAVMRIDDRGVGESTGCKADSDHDDLIGDLRAALDALAHHLPSTVELGLVGHSEGGVLAARAATSFRDVRLLVLLACPAMPGAETSLAPSARLAAASGASPRAIEHELTMTRVAFGLVSNGADPSAVRDPLIDHYRRALATWPDSAIDQDALEGSARLMAETSLGKNFRAFLRSDPERALRRMRCPVLALYGARDLQVPADLHLPRCRAALGSAPSSDVSIELLPESNHLFQTARTGSPNEYPDLAEAFAPSLLDHVRTWIEART